MTIADIYVALEEVFPPTIVTFWGKQVKSQQFTAWFNLSGEVEFFLIDPTTERLAMATQAIASLQEEEE